MRERIFFKLVIFLISFIILSVYFPKVISAQNKLEIAEQYKAIGIRYYNEQNYEKAIDALKRARLIEKENFEIYFYLGLAYYKTAKWEDAISALKYARFYNSTFAQAYYHLGLIYEDRKNPDEAIKQLNLALKYNPNYFEAAYYLGLTYYKDKGQKNEAISYFQKVIEIKPDYIEAYNRLGEIHFNEGKFDDVIKILRNIANDRNYDSNAFYYLGVAYYHKRDYYPEVIKDSLDIQYLQKATIMDRSNKKALLFLGDIYLAHNNYTKAINEYQKALVIDPENTYATEQIRFAREKQVQMRINNLYNKGISLSNLKKWEEAILVFEEILSIKPDYEPAIRKKEEIMGKLMYSDLYEKGLLAKGQNDPEIAMRNFQQALKFTKNSEEIDSILSSQKRLANDLEENERKQNANIFFNEGWEDYRSKDYISALDKFKIAITFDTSRTEIKSKVRSICYDIAQEEKNKKNWTTAKFYLEQLLEFSPDSSEKVLVRKELKEIERITQYSILSLFKDNLSIILSVLSIIGLIIIGYISYKTIHNIREELSSSRNLRNIVGKSRLNPYIVGQPISDEYLFIHMKKEVDSILRGIHGNSYLIKGERRSGKTSLLLFLKKKIEELNDSDDKFKFIPFFLDLQKTNEKSIYYYFAAELINNLEKDFDISLDLNFYKGKKDYSSYELIFDLQNIINHLNETRSKEIKLIFMVDELDIMNNYSDWIKSSFRSIFTDENSRNIKIIATATNIKELTSEGSPWCNFFIEIKMPSFTAKAARKLIQEPVRGMFRYADKAVKRIVDYSSNNPNQIQNYCRRLVDRAWDLEQSIINIEDVEAVHHKILKEGGQ